MWKQQQKLDSPHRKDIIESELTARENCAALGAVALPAVKAKPKSMQPLYDHRRPKEYQVCPWAAKDQAKGVDTRHTHTHILSPLPSSL